MKPTLQEARAVLMLAASIATTTGLPGVALFIEEHPDAIVAAVTGAWGLVAAYQAWRKRKERP